MEKKSSHITTMAGRVSDGVHVHVYMYISMGIYVRHRIYKKKQQLYTYKQRFE